MLNVDVSFLFMKAAYHFAVICLFFAIIIKYTMKCDSIEVRYVVGLTWYLHLCFKEKPLLIKHGVGE